MSGETLSVRIIAWLLAALAVGLITLFAMPPKKSRGGSGGFPPPVKPRNKTTMGAYFLIALLAPLTGCALFGGGGKDWYSGPGHLEQPVRNSLVNAVAVVQRIEGVGSMPPRVSVQERAEQYPAPPPGAKIIAVRMRAYFAPPYTLVFGAHPSEQEIMEECLHLVRYNATGAFDHAPRYNPWWVAH